MKLGNVLAIGFGFALVAASIWSESEMADDYRANKIAQEEAEKLGLQPDYEAARRPKKKLDECG